MQLNPNTEQAYNLLHNGVLALSRAERQGIRVDLDYAERKKLQLTKKIKRLESEFKDTKFYRHWEHSSKGKVNINSGPQLRNFLYNVKKLEPSNTTKTGLGSTNEETLKQLNIPELDMLLEMKKLKDLRDKYLDAFTREAVDGYIHPFFNLHLVRTFRSSSDSPNFQNIPVRDEESMQTVRKALYPRPGHQLFEADFKGLEVSIAACYHKDKTMLKYLHDPTSDMHGDMAEQIFKIKYDKNKHKTLRDATKNGFVFPEFYGDYFGNCAPSLACKWGGLPNGKWKSHHGIDIGDEKLGAHMINNGFKSLTQFTKHIQDIEHDLWTNRFPDYAAWKEVWWNAYQKCGYIDLLTGFRCSGLMGFNDCTNWPIQGSAFHCLLWSFNKIDEILYKESWDSKIIGQIHDSIIFDAHPDEMKRLSKLVREITCVRLPAEWPWIIVPLQIEADLSPVDCSWAEKEKYDLVS